MGEAGYWKSSAVALYDDLCRTRWNLMTTGIVVALLSILMMAWWRPWGAVGALRNWGDWLLYGLGYYSEPVVLELLGFIDEMGEPLTHKAIWFSSGSVIGIGFITGAFIAACLGFQFALRFPPVREWMKALLAGILMGMGAALAGGCNIGGMYNALGNLAANGLTMWVGLALGVAFGLFLLYQELEHLTWGERGAFHLDLSAPVQLVFGLLALGGLVTAAYGYAGYALEDDYQDYITSLPALLLLSAALGYAMQRGRWCMVQGFREPLMSGDCRMAKSVALSIFLVALGAVILKVSVPMRAEGEAILPVLSYVRGTFGWSGLVGGFLFGLGSMLAGGCGTGALWRLGEGQVKLLLVIPVFAVTTSLCHLFLKQGGFEAAGQLGAKIYLPASMGYGATIFFIGFCMALWYWVVSWNEKSKKLILPM